MLNLFRQIASLIAQSTAFEIFVDLLDRMDGQMDGSLRILTYHRVDNLGAHPWLDPGLISASPGMFEEQMRYLATHYQVVTVEDVVRAMDSRDKRILPPRAVVVTFDDAYVDFEEHAWPILKHYKIPVTLFVPTAYPGHPELTFWWDNLYHAIQSTPRKDNLYTPIGSLSMSAGSRNQVYKRLKNYLKMLPHAEAMSVLENLCIELEVKPSSNFIMNWESLRKLARDGVTLGAHTQTHPLMNRIPVEDARNEVIGSLQDLEREIGSKSPIFAYPGGGFNNEVVTMLKQEGLKLAFTTQRGINNIHRIDPLRMLRINVGGRTTLPVLRAQLLRMWMNLNWVQAIIDG